MISFASISAMLALSGTGGEEEPIGSGVTEAACKVIVKQRLCCSGMKWKESGAAAVLSLRCLTCGSVIRESNPM